MKLKTYSGPLPIHPRWYESPLGTCRSGDLCVAPSRIEEHDARYTIRIYKDTMCEDAIEFSNHHVCAQTRQELKIAERVSSYNAGDMNRSLVLMSVKKNVASGKLIIAVSKISCRCL